MGKNRHKVLQFFNFTDTRKSTKMIESLWNHIESMYIPQNYYTIKYRVSQTSLRTSKKKSIQNFRNFNFGRDTNVTSKNQKFPKTNAIFTQQKCMSDPNT